MIGPGAPQRQRRNLQVGVAGETKNSIAVWSSRMRDRISRQSLSFTIWWIKQLPLNDFLDIVFLTPTENHIFSRVLRIAFDLSPRTLRNGRVTSRRKNQIGFHRWKRMCEK